MRWFRLVERRAVWLPTASGLLLLAVLALVAALLIVQGLYPFLAQQAPANASVLVVEGWIGEPALEQAVATIRAGRFDAVITTGGPVEGWPRMHDSYAERAADYLRQAGVPAELLVPVPSPKAADERTYRSAVAVREWAARARLALDALDVYTEATHARRSRLLYERAFGGSVKVGVYAAIPTEYDPRAWWKSSSGARQVLSEAIGLAWACLFLWPAG